MSSNLSRAELSRAESAVDLEQSWLELEQALRGGLGAEFPTAEEITSRILETLDTLTTVEEQPLPEKFRTFARKASPGRGEKVTRGPWPRPEETVRLA